jgi:hypothetical protein
MEECNIDASLCSELSRMCNEVCRGGDEDAEKASRDIQWQLESFLVRLNEPHSYQMLLTFFFRSAQLVNHIAGFIKTADFFDKAEQHDLVSVILPVIIQGSHHLRLRVKLSIFYHAQRLHSVTMYLRIRGVTCASRVQGKRC